MIFALDNPASLKRAAVMRLNWTLVFRSGTVRSGVGVGSVLIEAA